MTSTSSMRPLYCVSCGRILGYVEGKASMKCRACKTVTLYLDGEVSRLAERLVLTGVSMKFYEERKLVAGSA